MAGAALVVVLAACSPTFNWRETRLEQTPLVALLPCKPDRASRSVSLGGAPVEMRMMGCETGGASFAVAVAEAPDAVQAAGLLVQWRAATLANFSASSPKLRAFVPKGAQASPDSVALSAAGKQADGGAVTLQAAWFVRDQQVFQALAYADHLGGEVAETFLSGIALQ